jgi:hypothetical protein
LSGFFEGTPVSNSSEMLAQREAGANAKVIEGEAEVVSTLPAPDVFADRPVKAAADNGAKDCKPRKRG